MLLKPVNKTLALLAASFRLLAHPAIASINLLNHYAALQLSAGAGYLSALEPGQLEALVMLAIDMHTLGYLIGGAFFGVHCFFLGWLLYRSELFPKILGVLLVAASIGYLAESFGNFLFPGNEALFTWIVAVPAVIGELSLTVWLLVKGVRDQKPSAEEPV